MAAIEFKAVRSKYNNCICNACRENGTVTKVQIPRTAYFDKRNLSTRYIEYWLCDECRDALVTVLTTAKAEA